MDISDRINQLRQMHRIILNINSEDMREDWMLLIGRQPDFEGIAKNKDYFDECSGLFSDLVTDIGYWQ